MCIVDQPPIGKHRLKLSCNPPNVLLYPPRQDQIPEGFKEVDLLRRQRFHAAIIKLKPLSGARLIRFTFWSLFQGRYVCQINITTRCSFRFD